MSSFLATVTTEALLPAFLVDRAHQLIQHILRLHGNQIPIVASAVFLIIAILVAWLERQGSQGIVAEIRGWRWTREAFCCGWLVTGGVGTGKTISGRNTLLYQVFSHQKNWGGLVIDDKGLDWETLQAMARHFGRENDLVLLRLNDENGQLPPCRFNLTSDRRIPFSTYGRIVVDVAVSLSQNNRKTASARQVILPLTA